MSARRPRAGAALRRQLKTPAQATAPAHFADQWRVGGAVDEGQPHAGRVGRFLGYATAVDGRDRCRLLFPDGTEAMFTPHELFPFIPEAEANEHR